MAPQWNAPAPSLLRGDLVESLLHFAKALLQMLIPAELILLYAFQALIHLDQHLAQTFQFLRVAQLWPVVHGSPPFRGRFRGSLVALGHPIERPDAPLADDAPGLATTHREQARHDRNDSYHKKTARHSVLFGAIQQDRSLSCIRSLVDQP